MATTNKLNRVLSVKHSIHFLSSPVIPIIIGISLTPFYSDLRQRHSPKEPFGPTGASKSKIFASLGYQIFVHLSSQRQYSLGCWQQAKETSELKIKTR